MREEIENNLQSTRGYINRPATENRSATRIEVINFEEIIIRDLRRIDEFPKVDEYGVGISPWFKVDVAGPLRAPYEDVVYKARLYPDISTHHHELGLHGESYEWGVLRRAAFLVRQDLTRYWHRIQATFPVRRSLR